MTKKKPKWISLACADIIPKKGKELKINSGMENIHIRFETITDKMEWIDELRKAQNMSILRPSSTMPRPTIGSEQEDGGLVKEISDSCSEILFVRKEIDDMLVELKAEADAHGYLLVGNIHNRMRTKFKSMKWLIVKMNHDVNSLTAQEFNRIMHSNVFTENWDSVPDDDFKTIYNKSSIKVANKERSNSQDDSPFDSARHRASTEKEEVKVV